MLKYRFASNLLQGGELQGRILVVGRDAGVTVFHLARSEHAARAASSLGSQRAPRAPQTVYSTCVGQVVGSRTKRQLSFPQKGQGNGREVVTSMPLFLQRTFTTFKTFVLCGFSQ